jgi:YfiH family protein
LHFLLTFADCVPLLFADTTRGVIGAAHAGWRGTALGIGVEVVRAMREEFGCDPRDIIAGIGPSIGPWCYVVGPGVAETFARSGREAVLESRHGETVLDLWSTNEYQLQETGIPADAIENPRICTCCHTETYFSHRGEGGRTGRFSLSVGRS